MNKRQSAALSNQSRSETIECLDGELTTVLTCIEATSYRRACWQIKATLMREGIPVKTAAVTEVERKAVRDVLIPMVKDVGMPGVFGTEHGYEWTILKEMTDEEAEKISLQHPAPAPVPHESTPTL